MVWDSIGRLEVVTISLAQGQDNPQLIFESMNSTGKDLSTADLVRNYVLMGLPMGEQENLYVNCSCTWSTTCARQNTRVASAHPVIPFSSQASGATLRAS